MERLSSYRVGRCGGGVSCGLGAGLEEIADSGFRIAELDERAVRLTLSHLVAALIQPVHHSGIASKTT